MTEQLPEGVSHLLTADDALTPGRWGPHVTLCGVDIRGPNATGADDWTYGTACVVEAARLRARAAQVSVNIRCLGSARPHAQ
ncbi:MAG TPA: hypothetical protein VIY28_05185 [Pseudonocardiaceae bacterium]